MNKITRENYRQFNAINYSKLQSLDSDPRSLIDNTQKDLTAFKLGKALETLLTEENKYNDIFCSYKNEVPTGQLLTLAEDCKNRRLINEFDIENYVNNNQKLYFSNRTKLETRKNKWQNDLFLNYLNFLLENEGKKVLSNEEQNSIEKGVEILRNSLFTKDIFKNGQTQVPFCEELLGFKYKALLDWLQIDGDTVRPFDLKSTSKSVYSFPESVRLYRYDIQSSLYWYVIQKAFENKKIADFIMVVYSFKDEKVIKYNMSKYLEPAKSGYLNVFNNKIKGWYELTLDLEWHMENKLFDYKKEVYQSNGEIKLEL